jgi:polysaccharide export outer membrane protein
MNANKNPLKQREKMKTLFSMGIKTILVLLLSVSFSLSQEKQGATDKPIENPNYVIGPEDVLYIQVWREEALTKTVPVRSDGMISLPLINDVQASGLTPLQLKESLTEKFKNFIENPSVTVVVMEANSFKVFVTGQVRNPGVYRLRTETTLLQIISLAGDFTNEANPKKIVIIRREHGKDKRLDVNYNEIIDGVNPGLNYVLMPGDTVVIPLRFK